MRQHRYKLSFFITLSLYAAIIGSYIYLQSRDIVIPPQPKIQKITLSLEAFQPPPPVLPDEPILPKPIEKPTFHEVTKPEIPQLIPPLPVHKPKPKPRSKKQHRKRHKKHPKKVIHKPKDIPPVPAPSENSQPVHETPPQKVHIASPAARNRFFATLRSKINQAKSYPRIAQKRHIQGIVEVSFTVTQNGDLTNLSVTGPKVFHASAKRAVQSAFPINTAHTSVTFPIDIRLKLRYQLH